MESQTIRIENWEVITLPWESRHSLQGEVFGHPRYPNGKRVTTSVLKDLHDDVAVTNSGTVYLLGKPKERPSSVVNAASATRETESCLCNDCWLQA